MALVSSSVDLWNPCKVLDVYPNSAKSSCVGVRNGIEVRCGWRLVPNDHFSASQLAVAAEQLKSMAARHPSHVTPADMRAVVQNTLCRHHQGQIGAVEGKWKAEIEKIVGGHGGMLETHGAVKHSQREVAEETDSFDLSEVKKALEASQARCTELMQKTNRLETDQAASARDLDLLRRQMAELQTDAKPRHELDAKVERLKTQMEEKHAGLEKDAAAGAKATQRLGNGHARLTGMMTTNNLELASLKANVRDRGLALAERARRSEGEANDLRRQLEARSREIALLQQAKTSLEARADAAETQTESLRQGLQESNARHAAIGDDASKRLTESLQALDRKHTDNHGREIALLQAATTSLDDRADAAEAKTESLRQGLRQSTARHAQWKAKSDDASKRLHASLRTLERKLTAGQDRRGQEDGEMERRTEGLTRKKKGDDDKDGSRRWWRRWRR